MRPLLIPCKSCGVTPRFSKTVGRNGSKSMSAVLHKSINLSLSFVSRRFTENVDFPGESKLSVKGAFRNLKLTGTYVWVNNAYNRGTIILKNHSTHCDWP